MNKNTDGQMKNKQRLIHLILVISIYTSKVNRLALQLKNRDDQTG